MTSKPSSFQGWVEKLPKSVTSDPLWKVRSYQLALFSAELAWSDTRKLLASKSGMKGISDQLYRAVGSVGANIAEGYSRGYPKDRARFYEFALGSARESKHWYLMSREILGAAVVEDRLQRLTEIIKLLTKMTSENRGRTLSEEAAEYKIEEQE